MAETIKISDNIKLEIGVHFSRFVKVYRQKKSLSLSAKSWQNIMECQQQIANCLEEKSGFSMEFTEVKSLRVSTFKNQSYVTFCEDFTKDEQTFTKHVSLDKNEWKTVMQKQERIAQLLDRDIIYCDAVGHWYMHEGQVENITKKRLVPRMCTETFLMQLFANRLRAFIKARLEKSCYGCSVSSSDTYAHMLDGYGCQSDWESVVAAQLEDAKKSVNLSQAVSAINSAMDWNMVCTEAPNNDAIKQVMLSHTALETCSCCKELLPVYWELYEYVFRRDTTTTAAA